MSMYRVRVRRHTYPRLGDESLSSGINWLLPDAALVSSNQADSRHEDLLLQFERDDHLQAVYEIAEAVQRLGYTLLNIEISELINQAVKAAVLGAAGSAGIVQAKAGKPLLTAIATIAGGYIAYQVAAQIKRYEVIYRFAPSPTGWALVPAGDIGHLSAPA